MAGRVCVVTGPTSGIGEVIVHELAQAGGSIVLVARDPERAAALAGRLREISGGREPRTVLADLSLVREVERASREILDRSPAIHLLINNAGAVFRHRELTAEGRERTWALNVLAPFLLTHRLLSGLGAGRPSRVINISSAAHRAGTMRWGDLGGERRYRAFGAYAQSKLALLLLTYEFARRLDRTGIAVNAVHPGFVRTRFGQNNPGAFGLGIRIVERLFAISPKRGARTPLFAAMAPAAGAVSGRYFVRGRPTPSSPASYDREAAGRLWERLCYEVGVPVGAVDRPPAPRPP